MSSSLILLVALFAGAWLLLIRPQRAKQQKQQQLLSSVEPGDEILTVGGIYGIVQELEEDEDGDDLVVEIAEGIHVRVARRAVATVVKPDEDEDDEDDVDDGEVDEDDVAAGVPAAVTTGEPADEPEIESTSKPGTDTGSEADATPAPERS